MEDVGPVAMMDGFHDRLQDLEALFERQVWLRLQKNVQRQPALKRLERHGRPQWPVLVISG